MSKICGLKFYRKSRHSRTRRATKLSHDHVLTGPPRSVSGRLDQGGAARAGSQRVPWAPALLSKGNKGAPHSTPQCTRRAAPLAWPGLAVVWPTPSPFLFFISFPLTSERDRFCAGGTAPALTTALCLGVSVSTRGKRKQERISLTLRPFNRKPGRETVFHHK